MQFSSKAERRRDDLKGGRLPFLRQAGVTVTLMTRLQPQEGSRRLHVFKGGFVKAVREISVRQDVLGNL